MLESNDMDAQNAVEPASTKPAASPKRQGSESDQPKPRSSSVIKSAGNAKSDPSSKDPKDPKPNSSSASHANDKDGTPEGNSDAETIVLPGKDGHSPSKVRKIIKREDKSDGEEASSSLGRKHSNSRQDREGDRGDRGEAKDRRASVAGNRANDGLPSKKKKLTEKAKNKDGSSGLSSAPASPPQRRRRTSIAQSKSDSETAPVSSNSPRMSAKEKPKSLDKLVPHKRKAPKAESDDEAESRKVRRQRTSGSGLDASRKHHTSANAKPHHEAHSSSRTRSVSPQPRVHRRSTSTQLPGQSANGLGQRKKKIPAPLQSTDYHSDESSAGGSPHPRSSKLRSLTTPATAESTISPAKMAPHKKHLDAHGQTFLARACAKGEYETAKMRLGERPEDINVADYAGNTPLQIAALNGYVDIVKLLVDAGCNLDCVNNDKDTPLLDAVENDHLEVVKILLAAGVNPRKANAVGEEPMDRIDLEGENADEIKKALRDARNKNVERRRTSEDHHLEHTDARSSHGPDSPRRSPGFGNPSGMHSANGRRAGTVRSTKTSNHLLYMPMDDKTLRAAAARGEEETVTRILQVRDTFDDPESMVAAARGGHDIVMQLLLALGKANPDPAPIAPNNDYATPMLAAIGQENIKVVKLLLDQNNFDPTRKYRGETYYEIAKRRKGPNWMEEEHMLKNAYDEFRKSHKDSSKSKSPNRREQDRDSRRSRTETKVEEASRSHKRKASSPARETKKTVSSKLSSSPKDKRRSNSVTAHPDDQLSPKRGPGRPKKEDRIPTIAMPDREAEASPAEKPTSKAKRADDHAAASSEGEAVKPRRKLVSGRELKGERDKHRRASMTSNASSLKEPSSPREEPEKGQKSEKYHDRTKALKRDESRDRLSVSGEGSIKRHRTSATPPHNPVGDKDGAEGPVKRRRLDVDPKEKRLKPSSSDDRRLKASTPGERVRSKSRDDGDRKSTPKPRKPETPTEHARRELGKSLPSEHSIQVKSEEADVEMVDADPPSKDDSEARVILEKKRAQEDRKKQAEIEAEAREQKKKEEERKRKEEEEKKEKERLRLEEEAKRQAEAEVRRREEEERKRKEEEEQEQERKRIEEEQKKKQKELEERKRKEEEERQRAEEEEKRRKEEERKREEEERRREEEKKRREEVERARQEEVARLRKEQLELEAAEEARRKREEEERLERERKERLHREEMERRRAAREAEQRRIRIEQERARVAKLPPLLRWLDSSAEAKSPQVAKKFSLMQGVRYDCIRPEATGTADGREQWLLNTQVALLLGEKDLELSRYAAWDRIPASYIAKLAIWRVEGDRFALTDPRLYDLGKQLAGYYGQDNAEPTNYRATEKLRAEAWEKFKAVDMFFVKVSSTANMQSIL